MTDAEIGAIAAVSSALITGAVAWLLGARKGRSETHSGLMRGFTSLVGELQEERDLHKREREAQAQQHKEEMARMMERLSDNSAKIGSMQLEIRALREALAAHGIESPVKDPWIG